jgi:hypothetical protein
VRRLGGRNPVRFFAPPVLLGAFAASAAVGVLQLTGVLSGVPSVLASVVYLGPGLYLVALVAIALGRTGGSSLADRVALVLALGIMHLSWGAGFVLGVTRGARDATDTSRTES